MRFGIALALGLAVLSASGAAFAFTPMQVLKKSNDDVRQILKQAKGGPPSTEQKERIKRIVNGFLDYEELAKRSLSDQWGKLKPAQRNEFVQVFRDLIERNYVKQLRSNIEYEIQYKDEEVKGADAVVHSTVRTERKGRSAETTIDYKLTEKAGRWAVYDVITDDVSLLRNYRSQFARIIERDGYPSLLAKMKKKLSETSE